MADPSLFQSYFNERKLANPAFNYDKDKGFVPSDDTKKIVDVFKQTTGKSLEVRPANSVMAQNGLPIWGSGHGEAGFNSGIGYVDPFQGTAHVVAHEGAHALMPSPLYSFNSQNSSLMDPLKVPRDTGQRMRYVHEILAKPIMEEEANAQGVAYGILNKLRIPNNESWKTPIDYPRTYLDKGIGEYTKTEMGPPTTAERKELQTILKSTDPYLQRMFQRGYNLIK